MRLSLFGHAGLIHFSFEGQVRQLSRNGCVDWVKIPHLCMAARLFSDQRLIEFQVVEDQRLRGYHNTHGLQAIPVSAFLRPAIELDGVHSSHFFEGPAEIGLKECAHQTDLSRGLFVHVFTMAGACGLPVMLDFTEYVLWG